MVMSRPLIAFLLALPAITAFALAPIGKADDELAARIVAQGIAAAEAIDDVKDFNPEKYVKWMTQKKGPKPVIDDAEAARSAHALIRMSVRAQQKQSVLYHNYALKQLSALMAKGSEDPEFTSACAVFRKVYEDTKQVYPRAERIAEIERMLPERAGRPPLRITNRVLWDSPRVRALYPETIAKAEALLAKPIVALPESLYDDYKKTGRRSDYEDPYFARINNLMTLVTAECLENKGRFLPKISEYVNAICAEKTWVLPSHSRTLLKDLQKGIIDLFSSERAMNLARVRDVLGTKLSEVDRELIAKTCRVQVVDPFLFEARTPKTRSWNWWYMGGNNWNAVVNSCCVRLILTLCDDRHERAEAIESYERTTPYFIAGFGDDGYCSEGAAYWNYGFGHHLLGGLAIRRATGGAVDVFAGEKQKRIMTYAYGYEIDGGLRPRFADGGGNLQDGFLKLGRLIWPDLASTRGEASKANAFGFDSLDIWFNDNVLESAHPTMDVLPIRTTFDSAQVFILRPDPKTVSPRFAVAIKGGHNDELHNHNDLGSYDIVLDGVPLVQDPGPERYTARTFSSKRYESPILNSYGHSVPVVGGVLQHQGRQYAAKIIRTDFTPARDTVVLDLKGGYPLASLKTLERTLVYDRKKNAVTVTDKVAFTKPETFAVPFLTYAQVQETAAKGSFLITDKGKTIRCTMSGSGGEWKTSRASVPRPPWSNPTRVEFASERPVIEASVSFNYTVE